MSLKDLFGRNKDESGVIVLKKTEPNMCGGTDATQDTRAPKEIVSEDMIFFNVTSALGFTRTSAEEHSGEKYNYVSAFAVPAGCGTFLFLEKGGFSRSDERTGTWAYVEESIFPSLVKLVNEYNLAKSNGFCSQTHGLPENFGGSVDIRYASGEKIYFSNNQSPVISAVTASEIVRLFSDAMRGRKVNLPDVSKLKEIHFVEERKNGGFTRANLTLNSDGTGVNEKSSRYDNPQVYESTKKVDAQTIDKIRHNIETTGLFAWSNLPDNGYTFVNRKTITFVFNDGSEITVREGRLVPDRIRMGFFNIELELTTKN